jgi:hypothetical protein
MMGDPTGITSLETDPEGTYAEVRPDTHGRIFHTNHIISAATSSYINEVFFLADTEPRLCRLQQLVEERITPDKLLKPGTVPPSFDSILEIMKDEEDAPLGFVERAMRQVQWRQYSQLLVIARQRQQGLRLGGRVILS